MQERTGGRPDSFEQSPVLMDSYNEEYQALLRTLKHKVPLQRLGTESELASAAVFPLSEASAFINGTMIRVDGGVPNVRHSWPLPASERTIEYNGFSPYQPPTDLRGDVAPEV